MVSSQSTSKEELENLNPRTIRDKAGLNVSEMADLMGMSEVGYVSWEKGTRRPGGPAYKLLFLLDRNPEDIVSQLS